MNQYDLVVIGAGPGGYPAAIRGAQLGLNVAIVEREALGGTCLNWGCIPTKALLASAGLYTLAKEAAPLGVTCSDVGYDYGRMVARKDEVVTRLTGGIRQLLKANAATLIEGTASFEAPGRLAVRAADGTVSRLHAQRTIIATGSVSAMPGFIPRHERVVESRAFLARTTLPKSLIVLGGGVIGCEFACLAAQLGTAVTIVEMLDDILPLLDRDVRRLLRRRMEGLGITIRTGAPLQEITATEQNVSGKFNEETLEAEMLLVAIGRSVETDQLGLDAAGVTTDKRGLIMTDSACRTSQPQIFANGDVVSGNLQLAHVATSQGMVAAEVAAGLRRRVENIIPACIFTSPEIGTVGMGEEEAKAAGRDIKVGNFNFAALGKALAANTTDGFVKWIADATTDQLLGAQAIGPHATELIATAAVAIRNELTAVEFGRTVQSHPTLSEAWLEAAHALHGQSVHAAPRRRR